jgi:hypothetical protein
MPNDDMDAQTGKPWASEEKMNDNVIARQERIRGDRLMGVISRGFVRKTRTRYIRTDFRKKTCYF